MWPEDLLPTLFVTGRPSVNFHQLSWQPGDLPSTSVNFPCSQETFHQLPSTFCVARRPFVSFLCDWETFRQYLGGRETFLQHLSNSREAGRSVKFLQLSVEPGDLSSTSFTFTCGWETICQPSLWPEDFPSNSVNFPCGLETFRQLL